MARSRPRVGAVVLVVLVAVVGVGEWWAVGRGSDDGGGDEAQAQVDPAGPGTPVPTSDWTPDKPAMLAVIDDLVLATEDGRCVFGLPGGNGPRTALVWPGPVGAARRPRRGPRRAAARHGARG
jgi:hypothetical protein